MKIKRSLLLALSLMFLMTSACTYKTAPTTESDSNSTKKATDGTQKEGQILNLAAGQEITTLNSLGLIDNPTIAIQNNLYEGLYRLDKTSKPTPGMAESYEVSEDGKVYTFHLRDAKWSNGTPVTAKDFDYAWRKALDPANLSPYASFFDDIVNGLDIHNKKKGIEELGVKAIDDHTFQVTLSKNVPYFLDLITAPVFLPQNKAYVESQGKDYGQEANKAIYNGPFVLDSWKHEEGYILKKNPDYWDAQTVKLETINFKIVKDNSTRMNLYEAGQLDMTGLTSEYTEQYKGAPEYVAYPDPGMRFLRISQKNKYLKNINIRKALTMGWNRQDMTNVILNNGSTPANYLVPKSFVLGMDGKDFRSKHEEGFNTGGIDEAKKYWEQGLKELGETSIKLELLNYEGDVSKTIGQYLKNQWEKNLPGLTVTINQQPQKQKLALEGKAEYDISSSGWGPDYPDPMTFLENFTSDSPYNQSEYKSAKYDQLINEVRNATDFDIRWKTLQEAERVLLEEDAAVIPMYQEAIARLTKPYVKDYVTHPFGVYSSYKWAYIEGKEK
ncbi:peptide ABC transporter substrate-binding protein [Paenibacillus sp. DMB20]|uniref:peptide ABC transporter substrate-binding protein n=1 Tax=Paenibacillus sp. DMB20 TaxID=1642570 RepID=UPI000627F669|nr:peptide ABC transporter substrate-binding protein [Paenibacillus sp. DMB20]KKO53493.1 hypothetical protein XI25_12980 [Paenibacillus sp. DMB20]